MEFGREKDEIFHISRELKIDPSKRVQERNAKWKFQTEGILNACNQACLASHSVMVDTTENIIRRREVPYEIFIPVVVTTADLVTCHFDIDDVEIKTGEINAEKIEYESRPWLIYEHTLPRYLFIPPRRGTISADPSQLDKLRKRHVFIVNSTHLSEFFDRLKGI